LHCLNFLEESCTIKKRPINALYRDVWQGILQLSKSNTPWRVAPTIYENVRSPQVGFR
jgi:hypothetical protein